MYQKNGKAAKEIGLKVRFRVYKARVALMQRRVIKVFPL
jgi:hypothetical protein